MLRIGKTTEDQLTHLTELVARRVLVSPEKVMPFTDLDAFLPHLLAECACDNTRLIAAGHVSADLSIAADRCELKVTELLGTSPFAADIDAVMKELTSGRELVYVANPNRVTGSSLGLADLELLAKAVPDGAVIIDEYYFDYFGITGITLLERYRNVAVLRSFTASFGVGSSDSGFVVSSAGLIRRLYARLLDQTISTTIYRTALLSLENEEALGQRLRMLHEEALRTSTELSRLGLQNRITAADFLLLRVKDPVSAGNHLARFKVPIENLDGYQQLKNYLRYKLQSPISNDRLIDAFGRMPSEYYQTLTIDQRVVSLRRPAEPAVTPVIPEPVIARKVVAIPAKSPARRTKTTVRRTRVRA
jgi:histidinol-phosphate/aromatic aminotransferase/cobyric acid decarboxylase-like protein